MIQAEYEKAPVYGYRKITAVLKSRGFIINKKRVQKIMRSLSLSGVQPKKNLSKKRRNDCIFPYLLDKYAPSAQNTVWCIDTTYVRTIYGYVYLVCLIDVFSRKIVGYDISTMPDTASALRALRMALMSNYRLPSIINMDQGSQFTSKEWINTIQSHGFLVSMDGKGRWADNIWIERFWRSCKYEAVHLHETYKSVDAARQALIAYINWYNNERVNQALNYKTPAQVYFDYYHPEGSFAVAMISSADKVVGIGL